MKRALFVLSAILVGLWYALRGPFYILVFYLWIAYFRPDQWLYTDFVSAISLSFFVGLLLLAATVMSGQPMRGGAGPRLLSVFLGLSLVSVLFSAAPAALFPIWQKFAETVVVGYLMIVLVTDEQRLRMTLLVIALSLGFEAAKQGWAQFLLNPGAKNENTWPFLGDNNAVAVGMLMLITLLTALAATASSRAERYAERFMAVGVLYRAIVTYSRGGFLACGALAGHALLRSKRKFAGALSIVIISALIIPVLPDEFWDRMNTIPTAGSDRNTANETSEGRVHFWEVAVAMANDHPFVGVGSYNLAYDRYDFSGGLYGRERSVHSVWFGVLSETGYPGLIVFLVIFFRAFFTCWRARRLAKRRPEFTNLGRYATAIEAGLVVVMVGGTFIPFQYNEMLWHFLALSMVIERFTIEGEAKPVTA